MAQSTLIIAALHCIALQDKRLGSHRSSSWKFFTNTIGKSTIPACFLPVPPGWNYAKRRGWEPEEIHI